MGQLLQTIRKFMPNYYNKNTFEIQEISEETYNAWIENNNPKANVYSLVPEKPSEDSIWNNGTWVAPTPPSYSANEWLEKEGYNSVVLVTLLDLETKLKESNKTSGKLTSVRNWINSILSQYIQDSSPKSDWNDAPYNVQETVSEAFGELNS
jgi:hypothetical protein